MNGKVETCLCGSEEVKVLVAGLADVLLTTEALLSSETGGTYWGAAIVAVSGFMPLEDLLVL
jgi:hypothetical protein